MYGPAGATPSEAWMATPGKSVPQLRESLLAANSVILRLLATTRAATREIRCRPRWYLAR